MFNGNVNPKTLPAPDPLPDGGVRPRYIDVRNVEPEQAGATLWEYWGLVVRGKYWLLGFGLLGCLIGFGNLLRQPPLYFAQTTVELQGFNESFMGMNAVDPQAGTGDYTATQANINTQIKIIESMSVRLPVTERLNREATPVVPPTNTALEKIRQRLRRAPMDPLNEMHLGLSVASSTLRARSIPATRIMSIACESTIPEIASNYVNALAREYIGQNTQQRSTTTQITSRWLESQVQEAKVKLEGAENRLETFVKQSGIVFGSEPESQGTLANAKLRILTGDLAVIQQERIARQTKFDAVNEMIKRGTPELVPEIGENGYLRGLDAQLTDARKRYAALTATFTPTNPKAALVRKEVEDLQAAIQKERENIYQRLRNEYNQAIAKEEGLKKAFAAAAGAVTGQQDKTATYGLLKREVTIHQQTLNLMLQQLNQASVVAAVPANNIRVLDPAVPSGVPISPNPVDYLGTGAGFGMFAGFGLVFLKERAVKRKPALRFGMPGYAPSVLSVPELGVIPSAGFGNEDLIDSRGWNRWKRVKAPETLGLELAGEAKGLKSWGWRGRPTLMVESFRLTMTSLMLMFRNSPRVLVVTSPGPGEGKTTISTNLAMAMAEAGKKVLLIDMDLRRPQVHTLFNLSNDHGFAELVHSEDLPARITEEHPFILRTQYPRVFVLPSGHMEVNDIGEMFHSPRVPGLLRQLKECFDIVIADTPPMLQFSESRLAGSFADGVLLVLRSGHTDKESAMAAREQLLHDRVELLGTILNDWDPKQSSPASRYASYYTSYMQYHKEKEEV